MGKEKYQLEILVNSSTKILYNALGTPSGLAEWFADDVHIKNDVYTFFWDGSEEQARLMTKKVGEYIRFQWLEDEGEDYFLEFRIKTDPLTKEVALIITDYCEPEEKEEAMQLWDSQVQELKHILGS